MEGAGNTGVWPGTCAADDPTCCRTGRGERDHRRERDERRGNPVQHVRRYARQRTSGTPSRTGTAVTASLAALLGRHRHLQPGDREPCAVSISASSVPAGWASSSAPPSATRATPSSPCQRGPPLPPAGCELLPDVPVAGPVDVARRSTGLLLAVRDDAIREVVEELVATGRARRRSAGRHTCPDGTASRCWLPRPTQAPPRSRCTRRMTFAGTAEDLDRLAGTVVRRHGARPALAGRRVARLRAGRQRRSRFPRSCARSGTPAWRTAPTTWSRWSPRRSTSCAPPVRPTPPPCSARCCTAALDNALAAGRRGAHRTGRPRRRRHRRGPSRRARRGRAARAPALPAHGPRDRCSTAEPEPRPARRARAGVGRPGAPARCAPTA